MSTVIAIGTRKGLWLARQEGPGGDWTLDEPHFLMQEVPAVAFGHGEPPRLMAGVRSEHWGPTVARSDDLGASWQETERGSVRFPEDTGAALERIWQIQPDAARPGVVWAGCEPTSLWRSTDGGERFDLVRGLWEHPHRPQWWPGGGGAAVHTVITDPDDDARVIVAMSTGGVYASQDAGASWQPRNRGISAGFLPDEEPEFGQCVHKVALDAGGKDRMYAQNHGGVFRTDDGGGRWVSIAGGLPADFGFPVLAHPGRPGTAWVVPLVADVERLPPGRRLRVHRTADAGESWSEVGKGLPDDAFTPVLRDAACVLPGAAGQAGPATLVLGTRDGWVYASEDDGDTFAEVARHLPDVLSVRATSLP
jgi:hypothetical protein